MIEIALQAQPRNCRLNPPIFPSVTALNSPRANTCAYDHHQIKKISELSVATVHSSTKKDTKESSVANVPLLPAEAQQKIQALEAELAQTKAQKAKSKSPPSESGSSEPLFWAHTSVQHLSQQNFRLLHGPPKVIPLQTPKRKHASIKLWSSGVMMSSSGRH